MPAPLAACTTPVSALARPVTAAAASIASIAAWKDRIGLMESLPGRARAGSLDGHARQPADYAAVLPRSSTESENTAPHRATAAARQNGFRRSDSAGRAAFRAAFRESAGHPPDGAWLSHIEAVIAPAGYPSIGKG